MRRPGPRKWPILRVRTARLRISMDGAYFLFCGAPQKRKGIDGLAQLCREKLGADPFSGCLFIFRSRRATAIKVLAFDGQGFWMAQKRLSKGRFVWWPTGKEATRTLQAHQAQLLFAAGNPETAGRAGVAESKLKSCNTCVPRKSPLHCGYGGQRVEVSWTRDHG